MSGEGIDWAWGQTGVTPNQRLVLVYLGHVHGYDDNRCFVGADKIALRTGLARRTVQRAIGALRDLGVIELLAGGGRGRANEYILRGLNDDVKGVTVPPFPRETASPCRPLEPVDNRETASPVRETASPVHVKGGTVTPPPGIHQVTPGGGARASARDGPPPAGDHQTVEEFVAAADPSHLVTARPELSGHVDAFLETFASKLTGTGRRTTEEWQAKLWTWWQREEGPGAREAWEAIRPQLSDSGRARTDDPVAAAVVAEMGGFNALGRMNTFELGNAEREFRNRYRAAQASPRPRHGPIGQPGRPDPRNAGVNRS